MNIWQMVTWDVARAGGFTAFGLLTLSVAIGLALTLHIQSPHWPPIINSELHNFITLLSLIFIVMAIATFLCMLGPFQPGWNSIANSGNSSSSRPTTHVALSQHNDSPRPTFPQSSLDDDHESN